MVKKHSKKLGALLLALVMVLSCVLVSAEETSFEFVSVSADRETIIKSWCSAYTSEMSGTVPASGGGETFVGLNYQDYVVFRGNFEESGLYDIAIGWGIAKAGVQKFNITIDDGEAQTIKPEFSGLGAYVPEYNQVLRVPFTAGNHTIKVESTGASGYLMGISLNCMMKSIEVVDAKVNGESITEFPFVDANAEVITVEFTEELADLNETEATVALVGKEAVSITPSIEGKILNIAINEKLSPSETYTLTINGVKDSLLYSMIENLTYEFVAYDGSLSTAKYPDLVFEAEDFADAGYYSGGYVSDPSVAEIKTEGNITYVELDNGEYINVPYALTEQSYYTICVVYATDSATMQMSTFGKYQSVMPKTADLDTFETYEHTDSVSLGITKANTTGRLRPVTMKAGEKCRIDKIIIKRGQTVSANGDVCVRGLSGYYDGKSDNFGKVGNAGAPATLYGGAWAEYVYDFKADGYYNIQATVATYKNNGIKASVEIDYEKVLEKTFVQNFGPDTGIANNTAVNPIDLGTYYFEAGRHVIRISNAANTGTYAYELFIQKTDTVDGICGEAKNSVDFSEGAEQNLITEISAGQYITLSAEVKENGYYGLFAMLSSAEGSVVSVTVDNDAVYDYNAVITPSVKALKQQKIADIYLEEGTHTFKFAVPEGGLSVGVNSVLLYKPMVEFDTLTEGNNACEVKLNGLLAGKGTDAAIAVYKEKDGVKQLCAIDFEGVKVAENGSSFDLELSNITFEDGYSYTAKVFVWNNMDGNVYTY